ncbi:MAG: T9SS type A sorting domain-containing protein [Flavobacteriales bacterium]|nr:T9SS type A sorting domain-containing protein [Flavobacteriales bacterium]
MKRILSALIIASASGAIAQNSLTVVSMPQEVWGNTDASFIQAAGGVENISGSAVEVKVRSQEVSIVPGTLNYFCWAQCYEPGVTLSPTSITLQPGERVNAFYGDYMPQGQAGISSLKYCFFNVANEADSVCSIVRFSASPVGINDPGATARPNISKAYPNPAANDLFIDYVVGEGVGRIDIYSMLGVKVKSLNLTGQQGRLNVNVASLPAGMYLYRLTVNGQEIQTKRFSVAR